MKVTNERLLTSKPIGPYIKIHYLIKSLEKDVAPFSFFFLLQRRLQEGEEASSHTNICIYIKQEFLS